MRKIFPGVETDFHIGSQSVSSGTFILDPFGIIKDVNRHGLEMYGYNKYNGLIGHSIFDIIADRDRHKAVHNLLITEDTVETKNGKYYFKKADGSEFPGKLRITLFRNATKEITGYLIVTHNITEANLLKQALRRYTKDLTTLNKVSQLLNKSKELSVMLEQALESLLTFLNLKSGVLYLLDETKGSFTLTTHKNIGIEFAKVLNKIFAGNNIPTKTKEKNRTVTVINIFDNKYLIDKEVLEKTKVNYLINISLNSREKIMGGVCLASNYAISLSKEDILLLETLGGQIGIAIENIKLLQKLNNQSITDELTGLYNRRYFYKMLETEIYRSQRYELPMSLIMLDIDHLKAFNDRFGHIAGDNLLKSFARIIVSQLRKTDIFFRLGGDEFAILLPDTESAKAEKIINRIRLKWIRERRVEKHRLGVSIGFSSGIAEFPKNAETQDSLVFLADAALYYSKKKGGHKITLVSELGSLSDEDKLINTIVDQVYALPVTVEARESFGFGHFKRVTDFSEIIGRAIGLSNNELEDLKAASLLHDVGKIGIPNEILTKPDKLTPQEWEIMKKHATEGAKIISQIGRIANLAPIIRYHHERYDGKGYPDGLKAEEIPICSRIISIADAYDSMITPRPYRSVVTKEEAIEELERVAGLQFDPNIVNAAKQLLSNYDL